MTRYFERVRRWLPPYRAIVHDTEWMEVERAKGHIVRFTAYEGLDAPTVVGKPSGASDAMSYWLYEYASKPLPAWMNVPTTPAPWYRRLWWRIAAKLPRIHLGPCNHDDCY